MRSFKGIFQIYIYTTEKVVYLNEWDYNLKLLKYRDVSILLCCRMAKFVYEVHVEETAVYGYLALHYTWLTTSCHDLDTGSGKFLLVTRLHFSHTFVSLPAQSIGNKKI